jgi:hypothetical protein
MSNKLSDCYSHLNVHTTSFSNAALVLLQTFLSLLPVVNIASGNHLEVVRYEQHLAYELKLHLFQYVAVVADVVADVNSDLDV